MNPAFIPIMLLLLLFPVTLLVMRVVSKEISRERLSQVEDLASLWKISFPPPAVLTDRGRRILVRFRVISCTVVVMAVLASWLHTRL